MNTPTTIEEQLNIFKQKLNKYIPEIYSLSEIKDSMLKKKINAVKERYNQLIKIEVTNTNYRPHCIYDLLVLAENDPNPKNRYASFLIHIETIVKEIKELIDSSLMPKVKDAIVQMMLAVDKKIGTNFQYLNFYGELLGTHFILKKGFNLIDIEKELPNGKTVDFVFNSKDDNTPLYMDFISYHNIDPSRYKTEEKFESFLRKKFEEKIIAKTVNLKSRDQFLEIDNKEIPFMLLPIIWGDPDVFLTFRNLINRLDDSMLNVAPMATLLIEKDNHGNMHYSFTTLSNVLERLEK
ncbi:hypothetical protein [Saccharicrinis sp. 156]|uniref:hypothetical protein n=1 Tax=Saccharicrinis sp. 156 TaxID=3417574 RepID=UPI003D33591B